MVHFSRAWEMYPFNVEISNKTFHVHVVQLLWKFILLSQMYLLSHLRSPKDERSSMHQPKAQPRSLFKLRTLFGWDWCALDAWKNKDHALQLGLVRLGGMKKLGWCTTGGSRAPWPHENAKRMHYNWDWCAVVAWSDKVSVRHLGLMRLIVGGGEVGDGDVDGGWGSMARVNYIIAIPWKQCKKSFSAFCSVIVSEHTRRHEHLYCPIFS